MTTAPLTRTALSTAVEPLGWRLLLGSLAASVAVPSLADGLSVAAVAARACGSDADGHLRVDVRPDRVELSLVDATTGRAGQLDVDLAAAITAALAEADRAPMPPTGVARPVQTLEIAIDTMDAAAIMPFWKAVLGYVDDPASDDAVADPAGQQPVIWFQEMDEPRPQRNRIHFDITVAHDEAPARIQAALDAGGVLVSDAMARAFWILADAEGNEVCVCTWQDRDRS